MNFKKAKCKVLYTGRAHPKHKYMPVREQTEGSPEDKDLGVLVEKTLSMT